MRPLDYTDAFVTKDAPGLHGWHVPLQNVQIGAADCRRVDAHDDIGRVLDARRRHLSPFLPGLW